MLTFTNSRYLSVEDMDKEHILFVQDASVVEIFNNRFVEKFAYFFLDQETDNLYGAYSARLDAHVYFVGLI